SVIVPHGDAEYYRARPSIAVARPHVEDGALDLDGFFGLHPRLAALQPLWDARALAVVHACGSPDSTRSHFDAQDFMESATPGEKATPDGWLNRYLRARRAEQATPFRAVSLTGRIPRSLEGSAPALALDDITRFGIRAGAATERLRAAFEAEYASAGDQVLNGAGREAFEAMRMLEAADLSRYAPEHGADYPRSPLGRALQQIAQLAKTDLGLEVAFAEVGGWDTHVNQGAAQGQLAGRLDDFGRGLAALAVDLGDRLADTVILTMSEFGRAVSENGDRGTDHGHANAMLVIGGGVRGGRVHGRWPGLAVEDRYEQRDLAVTTDFRDVFGEIVVRHMGVADPRPIFPGYDIDAARFPGLFS
ncbi:MAG: DUF1501 domain-containing protein, partial [Betaproteobacteria bacterium]